MMFFISSGYMANVDKATCEVSLSLMILDIFGLGIFDTLADLHQVNITFKTSVSTIFFPTQTQTVEIHPVM